MKKLFVILNVLLVIMTIGSYIAPHVHPSTLGLLPILGLGYPALLFANLIAITVWFFWYKKYTVISLFTLIIGIPSCQKLFTVSLPGSSDKSISIATYNANFSKPIVFAPKEDQSTIGANFKAHLKENDHIDILCLQEYGERTSTYIGEAMTFPYRYQLDGKSVAILSKWPIVDRGMVDFKSTSANICLWADISINNQVIRVYTTHLESNRHDGEVPDVIAETAPEAMSNSALLGVVRHYQKFSIHRVTQAHQMVSHKAESPHPVIICGDMNDTPQSHVYRVLSENMQDSWLDEGLGIGSTFGEKIPALRIDYIFADDNIDILDHNIHRSDFSDHYLVESVVEIK